jgi:hypothetical protein
MKERECMFLIYIPRRKFIKHITRAIVDLLSTKQSRKGFISIANSHIQLMPKKWWPLEKY